MNGGGGRGGEGHRFGEAPQAGMEAGFDAGVTAYRAFVRKARQATHQALYFVYHLEEWSARRTAGPVLAFRPFALTQARGLLAALVIPAAPRAAAGTLGTRGAPADVTELWRRALGALDVAESTLATTVDPLRVVLEEFLHASTATGWGYVNHLRDNLTRLLAKHVATLTSVLVLGLTLSVPEQIRSLLVYGNRLGIALVPFACLGLIANIAIGSRFALLRVGRRAFWQPWDQALEPEPGIARWPPDSALRSLIAGSLLLKVGISVLAQALGFLAVFSLWDGMHGSRTAGVIVSLATVLLLVAHVIDRWDFMDERPTRLITLTTAVICAVLAWFWGRYAVVAVLAVVAAGLLILRNRPDSIALDAPPSPRWIAWFFGALYLVVCALLIVGDVSNRKGQWRSPEPPPATSAATASTDAATAGQPPTSAGSPRAAGTRRVAAPDWPYPHDASSPAVLIAASGGGSRAAIYAALTLGALPARVRAHVQAISSVSGGSLTSAAYIQKLRALARSSPPGDFDDGGRAAQAVTDWVSDDFLLPTLEGAACPVLGRGQALERYWQSFLGTDRVDALAVDWMRAVAAKEPLPPFPLPLFNACTLDGHDLVISAFDADLYRASTSVVPHELAAYPGQTITNVFDRDGIYALEDLLDALDVPLTSAVRASANFPFGFPLISLWTSARRLRYSALQQRGAELEEVKLTDGGVLSNSGMWSLYNLLMKDPGVLDRLKRRGVLLVVIEASKMPSTGDELPELLALEGRIGDKQPKGQRLHRMMFENLKHEYGDGLEILQVDLTPTEAFNVGTTWALDTLSTRRLRQAFAEHGAQELSRVEGLFDGIARAATTYRAQHPEGEARRMPPAAPAVSFERPPGD